MTILSIIQDAADELAGLSRPSAAVASTERETQRLLRFAYRTGDELILKKDHPSTIRQSTVTLVTGQTTYALPPDFLRYVFDTHWDATNHWMLLGPYTPQEWQALQRGVAISIPRRAFRVHERTDNQFEISSAPSSSENGNLIYFEYISKTWLLPAVWTALSAITLGEYRSYNGNIYTCTVAGTTSAASPPTVTTGTVTEGTVTWAYSNATYNRATADTAYSLINEDVITLGAIWRYLRAIGNEYAAAEEEFNSAVDKMVAGYTGARTLSFAPQRLPWMIGPWNVPDSF
jgi:hypothetical protein